MQALAICKPRSWRSDPKREECVFLFLFHTSLTIFVAYLISLFEYLIFNLCISLMYQWPLGRNSIKNLADGATAGSHQCESCWRWWCRCESPYYLLSFVFKPQQHKWKWRTPFMTEAGNNTTMPPTLQFENNPFSPRWWKMNNLIGEMSSVHPLPQPCLCWNLNHIAGHVAKNEFRHFVCLWSKERFFRILCKDDFLRKLTRPQVALPAFVGQIENENKQNVS